MLLDTRKAKIAIDIDFCYSVLTEFIGMLVGLVYHNKIS